MPTYQYRCGKCSEDFDIYQSFSEHSLTVCPLVHGPEGSDACGGEVKKVFGNIAVTFKGSGFYKTDSRNGSKKSTSDDSSTEKSESSSTSTDTSTTKTESSTSKSSESKSSSKSDSGGSKEKAAPAKAKSSSSD